jgi:hypothetical protein
VDYKPKLALIPVSGLDRARDFCTQAAGTTLEAGPRNTNEGGNR